MRTRLRYTGRGRVMGRSTADMANLGARGKKRPVTEARENYTSNRRRAATERPLLAAIPSTSDRPPAEINRDRSRNGVGACSTTLAAIRRADRHKCESPARPQATAVRARLAAA